MSRIINPDLYHGKHKKKNFFEGWYFKIVDKNNENQFAFIPGISKGNNPKENHSFLQVLDSKNCFYSYFKYDENYFSYNNTNFKVKIHKNYFSLTSLKLNISHNDKTIKGKLKFKNTITWPDSNINPGSMGFYNYLWFMECYSQVCILDGTIDGSLVINNKLIDFTNGKVYIEKNWGSSFPKSWVWVQSNSFQDNRASITCSLATIPFPLKDFRGFLIGVTVDDYFYNFTTINRSKLIVNQQKNDIEIIATNKEFKLTLKTFSNKNTYMLCKGPLNGEMIPLVNETLSGTVLVTLENIKTNTLIYSGTGKSTGIEYGGEFLNIIDN